MKFKVWDSLLEQFESESNLTEFTIGYNGQLWEIPTEHQAEKADSKYYPVFSTGIKDKNKIDIYDGDLFESITKRIVEIVWGKNYPIGWCLKYDECTIIAVAAKLLNKSEIIGNRFENPDLLT